MEKNIATIEKTRTDEARIELTGYRGHDLVAVGVSAMTNAADDRVPRPFAHLHVPPPARTLRPFPYQRPPGPGDQESQEDRGKKFRRWKNILSNLLLARRKTWGAVGGDPVLERHAPAASKPRLMGPATGRSSIMRPRRFADFPFFSTPVAGRPRRTPRPPHL